MKTKDLRSMSKTDLDSKLLELRKELIKHNAQIATGTTPKSPGQVREIKKAIAKILTIANTKLEEQKSSSGTQTKNESDSARKQKEESKEATEPSKKEKKVEEKKKAPAKKSEEE